jgi:hypothetical protein
MYRQVGAIALGLALCAAMMGEGSPQAPIASRATANAESHAQLATNQHVQPSGLSDRDGPAVQDVDAEVAAVLAGGPAAPDEAPVEEPTALPSTGYSNPDAAKGPTPEQIRSVIEQSYRRSGNDGGGD